MTTDQPTPRRRRGRCSRFAAKLGVDYLAVSFVRNLYYFWVGRFGGALAYFLPAVVALAVFLARGPRSVTGWLALAALVVSWLFYIRIIPDNWYGGGGTVGNRYFEPAPLFVLMPRAKGGSSVPAFPRLWARCGSIHCTIRCAQDHDTRVVRPSAARADDAERPVRVHPRAA